MFGAVIPSLVYMVSDIYRSIDDNKRRKLGLPARPKYTLAQTVNKCEAFITKFKEEDEPVNPNRQEHRPSEDYTQVATNTQPFDFFNTNLPDVNNDTEFGGGSFGGGGASSDW